MPQLNPGTAPRPTEDRSVPATASSNSIEATTSSDSPLRTISLRAVRDYIDEHTSIPSMQYGCGELAHSIYRAEVVIAMEGNIEKLTQQMIADGKMGDDGWQLGFVREIWREELDKVNDMLPKRLLLDLTIANGRIRGLEERVLELAELVGGASDGMDTDYGEPLAHDEDDDEVEAEVETGSVRGSEHGSLDGFHTSRSPRLRRPRHFMRRVGE